MDWSIYDLFARGRKMNFMSNKAQQFRDWIGIGKCSRASLEFLNFVAYHKYVRMFNLSWHSQLHCADDHSVSLQYWSVGGARDQASHGRTTPGARVVTAEGRSRVSVLVVAFSFWYCDVTNTCGGWTNCRAVTLAFLPPERLPNLIDNVSRPAKARRVGTNTTPHQSARGKNHIPAVGVTPKQPPVAAATKTDDKVEPPVTLSTTITPGGVSTRPTRLKRLR